MNIKTPAKFAHVVFRTAQFDAMVEWWCTVLGAHPVFRNPMLAFLTYDDEHHRIALLSRPLGGALSIARMTEVEKAILRSIGVPVA